MADKSWGASPSPPFRIRSNDSPADRAAAHGGLGDEEVVEPGLVGCPAAAHQVDAHSPAPAPTSRVTCGSALHGKVIHRSVWRHT